MSASTSSALKIASGTGLTDEVAAILSGPRESWAEQLDEALLEAIAGSHRPTVKVLLDGGAKLKFGSYAILLNRKNVGVFQELLDHGFDINTREFGGEPPLRIAVGNPALTQWLLANGANPNIANNRGVTSLATAAIMSYLPALDMLLAYGAALDPDILHSAMRPSASGGATMVESLILRGADVRHVDARFGTPLHYAAYLGLVEESALLLSAGADAESVIDGLTPAALAEKHGNIEVHQLLSHQASAEK